MKMISLESRHTKFMKNFLNHQKIKKRGKVENNVKFLQIENIKNEKFINFGSNIFS